MLGDFDQGIAIGTGVARELGVGVGDVGDADLARGDGHAVRHPAADQRLSRSVYVFGVGRFDIDRTRVYMPFAEAQSYFNREGAADEIEVMVADPTGSRSCARRCSPRPGRAAWSGPGATPRARSSRRSTWSGG